VWGLTERTGPPDIEKNKSKSRAYAARTSQGKGVTNLKGSQRGEKIKRKPSGGSCRTAWKEEKCLSSKKWGFENPLSFEQGKGGLGVTIRELEEM